MWTIPFIILCEKTRKLFKGYLPKHKQYPNICAGPSPYVKPAKSVVSTLLPTKPWCGSPQGKIWPR